MTTLSGDLLLRFMDATASLRSKGPPVQAWLRERVLAKSGHLCWHCRLPASAVVPLFSPALGGLKTERNLMAVCPGCRVLFLDRDPLSLAWETGHALTDAQAQQRLEALGGALHHVVPSTAQRSVATCTEWLAAHRWLHPRVPVAVSCADGETLLAPVAATPGMAWGSLAMACKQVGAEPVKLLPSVFVLPSRDWETLAWLLIERGALLTRVAVTGVSDAEETLVRGEGKPVGPGPWDQHLHGVQQAARGRAAKARTGFGHRDEVAA
jgi:hypothetical protein